MVTRRTIIQLGATIGLSFTTRWARADGPRRLVFIHGRSQQGKDPVELRQTWIDAFARGAAAAGATIPEDLDIALPFYGDTLDEFARQLDLPLTTDIQTRGEGSINDEFLQFQAAIADELRVARGIPETLVDDEYGDNPKEKGPLNWEWVQAILRTVDKHGGGIGSDAIERFTRDVFLYTRRSVVKETIDNIVAEVISDEPTIIVGHSLGSVVGYSVLLNEERDLDVPLYMTLGSPLGIRAIRNQFRPIRRPRVEHWYNAFDERDVVALYPLDEDNFDVDPPIENYGEVRNHTDNRHGIIGYLDDPTVATRLLS